MLRIMIVAMALLVMALAGDEVRGQAAARPAAANRPAAPAGGVRLGDLNVVDDGLKGNDNFEVQQALDNAIGFLTDGRNNQKAAERVPGWLHTLIGLGRLDEVEDLAVAVINARPTDLKLIEACQQARIRAKLLAKKPGEGLVLAKSLYNVCAMPDTSRAIDLISECLYDLSTDGDAAGDVKRFKLEQIHGAAATQPSAGETNTLSQIQIDPKPYSVGLEHAELVDNGWDASMGRGNLLLLGGQVKEATKEFQKAYSLASDNNLAAATEAVARCMRAEDGTVGRANAWILSLRPPEQAGQ
jgi:hypothetical protein